jgi:hypothetical protein
MTKSWFPILLELVVDVPQMFFPEQDLPLNTAYFAYFPSVLH